MNETATSKTHFSGGTTNDLPVDQAELRGEVRSKYSSVATDPSATYHFYTGRAVAELCRYDMKAVAALPEVAVESFAGVANPFELRSLQRGERVVDLGSGAGMDSFLAARAVGPDGDVIGIDMTAAMMSKARSTAASLNLTNVEFCDGYIEELPVTDGWADVVISNGVINLCPDKSKALAEAWRILRAGGVFQFADIANGKPVPKEAQRHIDLWTG